MGRNRRICEHNIKTDIKKDECLDWIYLAHDRRISEHNIKTVIKNDASVWIGFIWLVIGTNGEYDNEIFGPIKEVCFSTSLVTLSF
jgi:hypothetical protein